MAKDIYISKNLVIHEELSELDLTLKDEFKFDWDSNKQFYEIDEIKDNKLRKNIYTYADTTPLNIKDLEKLITKFKKKGVTHIQMLHHGDHQGYEFSGFKIGLASEELIERFTEERTKKKILMKEYNELKKKMNKIQTEFNKLKV